MKKLLTAVVIVAVVLVAGYFLAAGVIELQAKQAARQLKQAGYATTMDDIVPWFAAGSPATAKALKEAAHGLDKADRQRLAYLDTLAWRTEPEAVTAFLSDKSATLDQVVKAAAMEPANFGLDFRSGMNCSIPRILPSFPAMRMLLSVAARSLAGQGRSDSALAMVGASLRLTNSLAEPLMIHTLAGLAGINSAFDIAAMVVPKASPEAIARLTSDLSQLQISERLTRAAQVEGVMVQQALGQGQAFYPFGEEPGSTDLTTPAISFLPLRRYAQMRQLQAEREELEIVTLPWYQGKPKLERHEKSLGGTGLLAKVARFGAANLRPFYLRSERVAAQRDAALLGLAALEQRRRTGKLPERLDEFAADAPSDRFSGKPYVYRPLEDGFVVYSIGSNEQDDGGDSQKDLVFRVKL